MERGIKAFADTSIEARSAALALEGASKAFGIAAQPVSQAAQAIAAASERLQRLFEDSQSNQEEVLAEMKELATAIRETQDAARNAWEDYRARFEGVDQSLENAGGKFADVIGDSLDNFRRFSDETDKEMASAVGKMGKTLDQIEEYAGTLSEFVEAYQRAEANR
jgi:methyl-accepting chemotaxis protein